MSYSFSPSKLAFFPDSFKSRYGAEWPSDAVSVTDQEQATFSVQPPTGKVLAADANGKPTFASAPAATLDDVKKAKIAALYQSCQTEILGNFQSSALGAAYIYPSKILDQQNLAASVLDSLVAGTAAGWTTEFWCADNSTPPVWARRAHTAAQIQQVGKDCKAFISAAQTKLDGLVQQVNAAADQATIDAIVW